LASAVRYSQAVPVPAEELRAYVAEVLGNLLPPIASRDPALAAKFEASLQGGVARLNAAPADDPIWQGTDGKPTFARMQTFLARCIAKDPEDDAARWALFAYDVCLYAAHFGTPHLEPIVARDTAELRWLVAAYRCVQPISAGAKTELRRSLARLKSRVPDWPARLQALAHSADASVAEAAKLALSPPR
jgi:hypothetical protein